ncbi:hypothetical protein MJ390_19300 [Klebsiella pneumoniae]|nr:hypothetical protein MJ390_19300 [Klebsiella pneumoniae]
MLTKATPEGARDYLPCLPECTKVNSTRAAAVAAAVQTAADDVRLRLRYYQIVKCFTDEDLRADRRPEDSA